MRLKVKVTEADIKKGEADNCIKCPIAIAIERVVKQFSGIKFWGIDSSTITLQKGNETRHIPNCQAVSLFIRTYDDGHAVKPFSFSFHVPDAWNLKRKR